MAIAPRIGSKSSGTISAFVTCTSPGKREVMARGSLSTGISREVVNAATPRLEIRATTTQTSVEAGDDITYEIEVLNTGGVLLTGVVVTDANAPDCARTIGNLAIGARSLYTCTLTTTAVSSEGKSSPEPRSIGTEAPETVPTVTLYWTPPAQ